MKKFAANYLITDTGQFLKNGMAAVGEDGLISKYTDTGGDLRELEHLTFHHGILMADFGFVRQENLPEEALSADEFESMIFEFTGKAPKISSQQFMECCLRVQVEFPEMAIPEIFRKVMVSLLNHGLYIKNDLPGLLLIQGNDLVGMKFSPKCKIRKIR